MLAGIILIVLGVALAAGTAIYAFVNIGKTVGQTAVAVTTFGGNPFDEKADANLFASFGGTFKRHIRAMIVMVIAAVIALTGVGLVIAHFIH